MQNNYLQIHPKDNVLVALQNLSAGTILVHEGVEIALQESIPAKQKLATHTFEKGDEIYMYGVLVGRVTDKIKAGEKISTANIEHATAAFSQKNQDYKWKAPNIKKWKERSFQGYHRSDGKVGTMNYWLVIPMVFCENRNIEVIESALIDALGYNTPKRHAIDTDRLIKAYQRGANSEQLLQEQILLEPEAQIKRRIFPNVDGIKFLTHEGGCGGTREDSETLCRLLASYITHPNVAGATVLSLGCQNAQVEQLIDSIKDINPNFTKPLYVFEQQQSKNERSFIEDAVKHTFIGLTEANKISRQPASLDHLVLGLECGGSDGFSGISANPALGYTSDLLVALGGTAILSEFPELNGVEQELINRCVEQDHAEKFDRIMKTYNQRAQAVGSGFEYNPSPGNIRDGLITDAIKSAGAAKKGGTSPVVDVLDYTETVKRSGLNLLCTPGGDVESTTGMAGAGANVMVFTTGLGTPTGNPITPVIKMSTNTSLYNRMKDIIDIDAGTIISGEDTIESKGEELLELLIEVASGAYQPHAVRLGQDDFIPWKRGISL